MVLTEEEKAKRPLTVEEVAEFLKLHPKTVAKWINEGRIKAVKLGREWRVPKSEIGRLLKAD